jgi:hypothetical protein
MKGPSSIPISVLPHRDALGVKPSRLLIEERLLMDPRRNDLILSSPCREATRACRRMGRGANA